MIQYIIAAGIGAFLGSQSKKSKKSYAHGGEVDDLEYSEIFDVLKDKIDDAVEDISSTYDQANDSNGEEVESKSRDGFIPYTNGGYSSKWFEYINTLSASGASLPTSVLDKEMQRQVDYVYELAMDRFVEENEELVKEIGEDKVNYHDLYELGYGDEAESLSEMESDMGDDSILMEVEAMYYAPHNERGIDGKNTIRLSGSVNLEAPYHRRGNLDDYIETEFTFNSVEELETKMDSNLKKVIGWFEGDNYSESKRELKIRRMAKGGIAYVNDDFPELVDSQTYVIDGTYGSNQTPTEVYVMELEGGGKWYAARDSVNVNYTNDSFYDGVDIETISDIDTITASKPIEYSDDLEDLIVRHYGEMLEERGDDYYAKGGEVIKGEFKNSHISVYIPEQDEFYSVEEIRIEDGDSWGVAAVLDAGHPYLVLGEPKVRYSDLFAQGGSTYAKGGKTRKKRKK